SLDKRKALIETSFLVSQNPVTTPPETAADSANPPGEPHDLAYSNIAGILINDRQFQMWLAEYSGLAPNAEAGDAWLKTKCNVTSKTQIIKGTHAGAMFEWVRAAFKSWKDANPGVSLVTER